MTAIHDESSISSVAEIHRHLQDFASPRLEERTEIADAPLDSQLGSKLAVMWAFLPPLLCAGILLTAAGLKCFEAITNPLVGGPLLGARWELLAVMQIEVLLALALLLGLSPTDVRRVGIVCFILFSVVNTYQLTSGASACGCFGPVQVHPAYTLLLDLAAIAALLWWRPRSTNFWSATTTFVLVWGSLLWVPIALASSTAGLDDLDKPGGMVVLNPEKWVGKPFPLLDHLSGGADLRYGHWVVVFHRRGCPACEEILGEVDGLRENALGLVTGGVRVACVELPTNLPVASGNATRCDLHPQLTHQHEWFMKTPTGVMISNGVTARVTSETKELKDWLTE